MCIIMVVRRCRRIREIRFIPRQQDGQIGRGERARIHQEGRQRCEGGVGGDVVDEDGAGSAAVVGARDGSEALGAGCVPELELDASAARAGAELDDAGGEFDADGLGREDSPCNREKS